MINTDFLHSVQNGDEDAIQSLIRAHQRQVFQLALSILDTSKTDSAEAAQQAEIATRETFISAVDHISRYREDSSFTTWLYGLAIQVARRRSRKWQVARLLRRLWSKIARKPAEDFYAKPAPAAPPVPAAAATASETEGMPAGPARLSDAALWDGVRALDERLRLPVVLRYYHDFPISEIAALLKTSEGSIHARLDQARDKLAGK